ncbi:hypothetical protein CVT26_002548 [Gymnopilus dilepis]|uniref:Uncharacterized protein n=1 Tax=Gymnopilus dilepis TaxID=231916 RepID=A0A409Y3N9_9AGAR|nr:hypothetical protein CVT26_002548 [Gymnopilus dilepis]
MAEPPDLQPIFFLRERLCSYSGYSALPTAFGAMRFYLPKFTVASRRAVQTKDKFWELWSPNSSRFEFYPGLSDPSIDLEQLPEHLRRSDGHLGRFDPTVAPQHYDPKRPWLGFIRRTSRGLNRPEFRPFLSVWKPAKYSNRGSIDPDYVAELIKRSDEQEHNADNWRNRLDKHEKFWKGRPRPFTFLEMAKLSGPMDLDDAVDELAKVQCRIKHMSAWCGMASALVKDSKGITAMTEVPTADDSLMGIWLNGCPEPEGLWLLRHRVPCFLIHEADSLQDLNRLESYRPDFRFAFPDGTTVKDLKPETHPIDVLAFKEGRLSNNKEDYAIMPPGSAPSCSYSDNFRSSPVGQDLAAGFRPVNLASPDRRGNSRNILRGKKYDPDGDFCWYYDRVLCRKLALLVEPLIPHSYQADPMIFGLPVPDWPFEELVGTERKLREASKWMYAQEQPTKGSVGLRPTSRVSSSPALEPLAASKSTSSLSDYARSIALDERTPTRNDGRGQRAQEPLYMNPRRVTAGAPYVGKGRELLPVPAPPTRSLRHAQSTNQAMMEPRSRYGSPPRRRSLSRGRSMPTSQRPSPYPRESSYHRGRSPRSDRHITPLSERSVRGSRDSYSSHRNAFRSRSRSPFNRRSASYRPETINKHSRERDGYERSCSDSPNSRSPGQDRNAPLLKVALNPPGSVVADRLLSNDRMDVDETPLDVPAVKDAPGSSSQELELSSLELASRITNPSSQDFSMSLDSPEAECMDTSWDGVSSIGINHLNPLGQLGTTSLAVRALVRPTIPILSDITLNSRSRFLCLWSLNKFYTWQEVTRWVVSVSKMSPIIDFDRVVRWYDKIKKVQLFYLAFKSEEGATTFRGIVNGRNTTDQFNIQCDFVDTQAYSTVSGQSKDSWRIDGGFGPGVDPSNALPEHNEGIRPPKQSKKTRRNNKKILTSPNTSNATPSTANPSNVGPSLSKQSSSPSLLSRIGPPLEASQASTHEASTRRTHRLP